MYVAAGIFFKKAPVLASNDIAVLTTYHCGMPCCFIVCKTWHTVSILIIQSTFHKVQLHTATILSIAVAACTTIWPIQGYDVHVLIKTIVSRGKIHVEFNVSTKQIERSFRAYPASTL